MFRTNRVSSAEINKFISDMHAFRKRLDNMKALVSNYTNIVQNTTTRNENANKELDNLDLELKNIQKQAKEFKANVTKIIEGNIGGALNSTLDSLRRSRAAQAVVDGSKATIKKSKKKRKALKQEILQGIPTFDKLHEDNSKLVGQLEIDVTDLEKKLKELNAMLCGDKCGGCTNSGCQSCGANFPDCKGVKQMATEALKKANEAKKLMEQKKGILK